ncbi:hypothetical protein JKF63_01196 [Porcisia hertigi]|uniref:Ankyrin repeat protein n=1 Tax=Porcisia hertigi TaxID=2761500 RepID=A0A836HU92_9TRYP|nr:hypothetical protein JKF63_01196 [Porcisia hertigi]
MEAPVDLTPPRAPVLCLVCTGTACGSRLVATMNVTLHTTLAEVRSVLVSLAAGGDGGSAAINQAPTNVSAQHARTILSSPLHPFDFTETFSFVHAGGCRAYARAQEALLHVEDVLPRYMRFGVPPASLPTNKLVSSGIADLDTATLRKRHRVCSSSCTRWLPDAAPPLAVVAHPRRRALYQSHLRHHHASTPQAGDEGGSDLGSACMPHQKRYALAALFISPGDRAEGGLRAERVVAERLQLQLPHPLPYMGAVAGGPGLFSPATLSSSYGRPFRVETWCSGVTQWNGNTEDLLGRTLLHEAAQAGNEAAVSFLVSQPYIVVDAAERQSGSTALQLAVLGDHVDVVKILLEKGGANPLAPNHAGDTPLHVALERRRAVLVGMLCTRLRALQVPPAVLQEESMRNRNGYTPMDLFHLYSPSLGDLCRDGASLLAVKALVHHYLFSPDEVMSRDAFAGQSVLHAAAAGARLDVLRYIAEDLGLVARLSVAGSSYAELLFDFRRQTPLHVAAAAGEPACVQYLLQKLPASFLMQPDVTGCTPLLVAMKARRWRVVELLLTQCPPGTLAAAAQDRSGLSALHIACSLGMTRVAAILLQQHGAVAVQRAITARQFSPSTSSVAVGMEWGSHSENTALVRHSALHGRLRRLEEREIKRQLQQRQQSVDASRSLKGRTGCSSLTLPEDADTVAAVKAARQYPYGGARRGYTPLRCALLHAVRGGDGAPAVPADLLRLLCEYGALATETADDTRDLLYYLLTHHSDANAESLLAWVMERCATAVAVLQRDNVLLCRLCAVGDAVGLRWCVEKQLGDLQATDVNPLVACAAVGNAAAAAFLIQCAGADVNALTGHESALAVALREGHVEVAQVLILSRAALSSGDGSWSALQQAVNSNLESVVRGLLGSRAIDPFDVSRVLLRTLQGLLYAKPSERRERSRLALYLAGACEPLACEVHPTELLHLSAAMGCFDVTLALVERLLALPTTVWAELLASAPPPPPRPTTRIEPTSVPLTIKAPRLVPNPLTGRGGLYRPPKPFYRLVVPTVRQASVSTLLHRVKVRDVYSFAVEAGQVDLVHALRYGLHLPPWPLRNLRGWTVTDYAMARYGRGRASLVALFVAAGIAPATRHGRRMPPTSGDGALVAAVHFAQRQHCKEAAALQNLADTISDDMDRAKYVGAQAATSALGLVADTLVCLVETLAGKGVRYGDVTMVRCILDAFLAAHHLSSFHHVPCVWLGRVVVVCAAAGRLDVLRLLREHYSVDLAQDWLSDTSGSTQRAPDTQPTPLLMAVHQRHGDLVTYLLKAGCSVHERSRPTASMAAHVPLKNIHTSSISPLCLAAWKRDYVLLRLLLAASPPLRPQDTEEEAGRSVGDVLRGLVMSARPGMQREAEAALADCVRALATAGHPLRFAGTVRVAAAKGLVQVAQALVECYGCVALLADLVVSLGGEAGPDEGVEDAALPRTRGQLTALAYFAADTRLVPVLRSLLVERMVDEYQLESWRLTTLAATVQALHRKGGPRGARMTAAAVDHALWRGCADGAVVLLALGLIGRGVAPAARLPRKSHQAVPPVSGPAVSLCLHLASTIRLWHKRSGHYQFYTVLHSAAELGYGDAVEALTAEMLRLHLPVVGSEGSAPAHLYPNTRAAATAPSLYALAATHADGWRWFPCFERVELVLDPRSLYITTRDVFALIFSGIGLSQAVDQVCRRAAQHKLLGDVFSVFDTIGVADAAHDSSVEGLNSGGADGVTGIGGTPAAMRGCAVSASFVSRQLQLKPAAFFLAGGTYVLTSMTSLTCAIAACSLEWVQYIAVQGPSLVYHRATATRLRTAAARRAAAKEYHTQLRATRVTASPSTSWNPRQGSTRRPQHRRHHCEVRLRDGSSANTVPVLVTDDVCCLDALTLCMTMLAEAHLRRRGSAMAQTYEKILAHLLSWPASTPRRETINLLAIAAASLRRWPLLMSIMQQADRLYAAGLMDDFDNHRKEELNQSAPTRYFFPLLPEELPVVLAHVIGSARHVMHAVARWAPKDVLIEVARHCQRSDVEAATDARGCTSVYHALQHRQAFALETFAALRVPMSEPCRMRQSQTPLMVAAANGRTALVTGLLKPHRINQRDREGRTALMLAAAHGHKATVEVLLAASADVSLSDSCGRTAVMLAALGGYDDLAVQLVQNFSHATDLISAQTSVLHCAAIGGCWRTTAAALRLAVPPNAQLMMGDRAEASALLVLREDIDGHTPLFLAHAFGSARVLRELLQVLFSFCGEKRTAQGLLAQLHTRGGGSVEKRLLSCDSTLQRHGWLSGVLEVSAALQERVRQEYAGIPAARELRAGQVTYQPVVPSLRNAASLMRWCVQTGNTVGLRVLADYNVADDCDALHMAAANGSFNVVKLLVELEMSNPSVQDVRAGRYAFEWAALYQHTECASFLLTHTVLDCTVLINKCMNTHNDGDANIGGLPRGEKDAVAGAAGSNSAASFEVPLLHVMAGHCGGQLLVHFVETTFHSKASDDQSSLELMSVLLYQALQRPAGPSSLTSLEYAIAVGDPVAVLRTVQVLERLRESADALKSAVTRFKPLSPRRSNAVDAVQCGCEEATLSFPSSNQVAATHTGAVFVSKSFLSWVPAISPAVRTILFDALGMWEVANIAGCVLQRPTVPASLTALCTDDSSNANGGPEQPQQGNRQRGGDRATSALRKATASAPLSTQRLRFSDVRLLGIHVLHQDEYCAEVLHDIFTPDHEREVLRFLLQDFPYKIRYEPNSYKQCSLSTQTKLLRLLGTSLVLHTYDATPPCGVPVAQWVTAMEAEQRKVADIDAIEIRAVLHRSEEFVELTNTVLSHSLYISATQHALVVPDVMATLPRTLRAQREAWRAELTALSERATRLLQRQAHPVMQRSTVTVDWDLSRMSDDGTTTISAEFDRYSAVFTRVCDLLRTFMDWVRGPLRSLLAEVDAGDLAAVAAGLRQVGMAELQVRFRYVTEERAVTRFPVASTLAALSSLTFRGDAYPSCCIEFNEVTNTDVEHACQSAIGRAIAADVALVRVHHARDRFLHDAHRLLSAPRGVAAVSTTTLPRQPEANKENDHSAAAGLPPSPPGDAQALKNGSHTTNTGATATLQPPLELLRFQLELEGTTLDAIPVQALERLLLEETTAAIDAVVSPWPRMVSPSRKSAAGKDTKAYDAFHSAAILSAALVRRLRSVLVLFTTRRETMVRLSGDKLMLCFTADEIPSRSDISAELTRTLAQTECDVYRQRLAEVFDMMTQRLTAYLPQARLVVDLEAVQKLAGDEAHLLSAMRLLVHRQSEWVLQRLVEGVSIGWDTEIGAVVRRHVKQVTLTLDPGLYGSCYLSPDGVFAYYCPLLCLEREPPGALTPSSLPSWQLLSAQNIASMLLVQLAVREPQVVRCVDRKRSVACWTTARRITRCILPGSRVLVEVHAHNLFNQPLRRGGERLRLMGEVKEPRIEDAGNGRYLVYFDAPQQAGGHRLFILLHGQPIAQSPLWYTVRPGKVDLNRTRVRNTFSAVVIGVPFTVLLQLRDAAGNRLRRVPKGLTVECASPPTVVEQLMWGRQGPGTVAVTLRVLPTVSTKTALVISLTLACQSVATTAADANGDVRTATVILPPYSCVDKKTYLHVCRVRRGLIEDGGSSNGCQNLYEHPGMVSRARTTRPQSSSLYFRRAMRRVARQKLAREAVELGGALGYRYPRNAFMKRLETAA